MYKLFKNLAILCFILLLLCLGLLLAYSWINAKQINGIAAKTLILGDSQSENGLNPLYMDSGTVNFSNSADPFYMSRIKLRVLSKCKKPKKLILPVSILNLRNEIDDQWINNDTVFAEKSSTYFGAIELPRPEGVQNDLKTKFKRFHKLLYRSIYTFEKKFLFQRKNIIGGYNPNFLKFDVSKKCPTIANTFKKSKLQIKELYAIQNYCVQNGIQLILVSMPKYCRTKLELDKIFKRHSSTKFIDCHDWYIGRADCFADFNHLNVKGSKFFSRRLNTIISKNELPKFSFQTQKTP